MSCENKKIADLIPDYFTGILSKEDTIIVRNHLGICQECLKDLKTMRILSGWDAEKDSINHIDSNLLTQYYQNPSSLADNIQDGVKAHLKECDECSYNLDFLVSLETELERSVARKVKTPSLVKAIQEFLAALVRKPAFAYFLLLLTLYPAGKWFQMSTDDEFTDAKWQVPQEVQRLSEGVRSAGKIPIVSRTYDSGLVRILVPVDHYIEGFSYSFQLQDKHDFKILQMEQISDFSEQNSIDLIINTTELADGEYILNIHEIDRADPTDTTTYPYLFRLQTE
jgi:hypothetical protein